MARRNLIWICLGAGGLVALLWGTTPVTYADNCGSLYDCIPTLGAQAAVVVAVVIFVCTLALVLPQLLHDPPAGDPAALDQPIPPGAGAAPPVPPPIMDPWTGKPLTTWVPGRYAPGADGNPGSPGQVWFGGTWVDPQAAQEHIAEALAADQHRATESATFAQQGQDMGADWIRNREHILEQEKAHEKDEDPLTKEYWNQAAAASGRSALAMQLVDRYHDRVFKPDGTVDEGELRQLEADLRTEHRAQQLQSEATSERIDQSYEQGLEVLRGMRDAGKVAAMGIASAISLPGMLINAGYGAVTGLSEGESAGQIAGRAVGGVLEGVIQEQVVAPLFEGAVGLVKSGLESIAPGLNRPIGSFFGNAPSIVELEGNNFLKGTDTWGQYYVPGGLPPGVRSVPQIEGMDCVVAAAASVHPTLYYEDIEAALRQTNIPALGPNGEWLGVPRDRVGDALRAIGLNPTPAMQIAGGNAPDVIVQGLANHLAANPDAKIFARLTNSTTVMTAQGPVTAIQGHRVVITSISMSPAGVPMAGVVNPAFPGFHRVPVNRLQWDLSRTYVVNP